jgi:hypothetical protein
MTKTLSQKITFAIALLCYLAAAGCAVGAFYYGGVGEDSSILKASLGATAFFFLHRRGGAARDRHRATQGPAAVQRLRQRPLRLCMAACDGFPSCS